MAFNGSAALSAFQHLKSWCFVGLITVRELAYLRLFHERLSCKTPQHVKVFEFLFRKENYFTAQEIAFATQLPGKFTETILGELSEKRLIEKDGCLFRCNGLAMEEIVECK